MTSKKSLAAPIELGQISKQYDSSTSDHSDSIADDDVDDANERNETQLFTPYTAEEERALVRKLDYRLVLFVAFLYMLSFLDRSSKAAKSINYPASPN